MRSRPRSAAAAATGAFDAGVLPALVAAAGLALLLGTLVYLLDRPAGSAWLIPQTWQAGTPGRWFGGIGGWLPSLAHAFAFSVLTACMLPPSRGFVALSCGTWALVDTLAELGQHPAVSGVLAASIEAGFDGAALAARVGRYFTQGSFDGSDVAAGLAGSALAFVLLRRLTLRGTAAAVTAADADDSLRTSSTNMFDAHATQCNRGASS